MNSSKITNWIFICGLLLAGFILTADSPAKADLVFGVAENLGPGVNTPSFESAVGISMDGLSFYFVRDHIELWVSTRATKNDPWGEALYLGLLTPYDISMTTSSIGFLATPSTADGLECYYAAQIPGGYGRRDIWYMKRETINDPWGLLMNLGPPVNTPYDEHLACVSPDGLELYFSGYDEEGARPGGYGNSDLWVTCRVSRNDPWTEPVNLGATINTISLDARPSISPDGLLLFFDSNRPGGFGGLDLYMTRRASLSDEWGEAINLGLFINSPEVDECARISADGSTILWDSGRPGGYGDNDIWQASIEPLVDFNGDGSVDCTDICIMTEYWGTKESLCDIAPPPFGDGIVDVQDLLVLAEHMSQDISQSEPVR